MISMLTKGLSAQKQHSAQDERMLELLSKDASYVSAKNLAAILQWDREKTGFTEDSYENSCCQTWNS